MSQNACESLIKSLTVPGQRIDFVVAGTSVPQLSASPQTVFDLSFNTTAPSGNQYLPSGSTCVITQRNPVWAMLYYDPNSSALSASYQATMLQNSGLDHTVSTAWNFPFPNVTDTSAGFNPYVLPVPLVQFNALSSFMPHGPILGVVQTPDGRSWFPLDGYNGNISSTGGCFVSVTFTAVANTAIALRLVYWDPDTSLQQDEHVVGVSATGTYNLIPQHRGYYTVLADVQKYDGTISNVVITNFAITYNACTVMCHRPLPGWSNFSSVAGALKIMGTSVLSSCIAPALNRNGDVLVTQQPYSRTWPSLLRQANSVANVFQVVTNNTPSSMYGVHNWEKGAYGFLKPEGGLTTLQNPPFRWRVGIGDVSTVGTCTVNNPYTECDYLLTLISTQTSNASGIARITVDYWVNYEATSPWLSGSLPTISTSEMMDCIDKVARAQQFHENPLHLGALLGMAANAARAIATRALPALGSWVSGLLSDKGKEVVANVVPKQHLQKFMPPPVSAAPLHLAEERSRTKVHVKVPKKRTQSAVDRKRVKRKQKRDQKRQMRS